MKKSVNRLGCIGILCAFVFLGSFLQQTLCGAEDYASLIEKDTKSIICLDVNKVDLSSLTAKVSGIAMSIIDKVVVKPEEKNQMRLAVPAMVAMAIAPYTPLYQGLKDNGVDKLYIVPTPKKASISPYFVAIPVGKKTDSQIQEIKGLSALANDIGLNFRMPFVRHGYVFFVFFEEATEDTAIKSYIRERFMKLDTVENPLFAEGFGKVEGGSIQIVNISDPQQIQEGIQALQGQSLGNESADRYIKEELPKIMQKISEGMIYGAWKIDLDEPSFVWYGHLKDQTGGETFLNEFPGLAAKISKMVKENQGEEMADIIEKLLLACKPDIQRSDLIFKINPAFFTKNQDLFDRLFKKAASMNPQKESKK